MRTWSQKRRSHAAESSPSVSRLEMSGGEITLHSINEQLHGYTNMIHVFFSLYISNQVCLSSVRAAYDSKLGSSGCEFGVLGQRIRVEFFFVCSFFKTGMRTACDDIHTICHTNDDVSNENITTCT